MGIQSLLPFLDKSKRSCHVSEFRGSTVAVDSYCWLHKGAYCCAEKLARGETTDKYVFYCLKFVKMLLSYDIKPIMVFDGRHLPAKLQTEEKRRQERKQARKQAVELLSLGKNEEARRYFNQCVDISPKMALSLIKECRKLNVDCIVAPYESDAQLAYFNIKGIAEVVITEDSDLLLFGCLKVLFKMDINGCGQLIEADKINQSMYMSREQYSFDKFRFMCILSGCDYVSSLPGIGLKKALKFISMTAETNPELFLDRIPRYLNMRHLIVDEEYRRKFMIAYATFCHQTVFDPFSQRLVRLNDVELFGTKEEYCKNAGDIFDHKEAQQLAWGNLNPLTMKKIDSWHPTHTTLNNFSIWSSNFQIRKPKQTAVDPKVVKTRVCLKTKPTETTQVADTEYDELFDEALEMYKKLPKVTCGITTDPTSPVLGNHSINLFERKTTMKSVVTKSRFFSQLNSSRTTDVGAFSDNTVDSNENFPLDDSSSSCPQIQVCFNPFRIKTNPKSEEINSELKATSKIETIKHDDIQTLILESEATTSIKTENTTLNSVENVIKLPPDATRKPGKMVSRTLSTKRKRQTTILDMFKRMES